MHVYHKYKTMDWDGAITVQVPVVAGDERIDIAIMPHGLLVRSLSVTAAILT